jgi:hypothetical protein
MGTAIARKVKTIKGTHLFSLFWVNGRLLSNMQPREGCGLVSLTDSATLTGLGRGVDLLPRVRSATLGFVLAAFQAAGAIVFGTLFFPGF